MCTILKMKKGNIIGKNYDALIETGMIFTNKRGIQKSALIMPPALPLKWESVYGSLTFSQNGKEMPVCGINEKGLVIEQATLPEAVYGENTTRRSEAGCLEIIQYALDTCKNVEEAIEAFNRCDIEAHSWPIHFILADEKGELAIIEHLQGEIKIYQKEITEQIVTNSPYEMLCQSLQEKEVNEMNPYKANSIERFKIGSKLLCQCDMSDTQKTFEILNQVRREDTQWQLVYEPDKRCVSFKTKDNLQARKLFLDEIDFSKEAQSLQLDFVGTDTAKMKPLCLDDNRKLIESFYDNEQIKRIMHLSDVSMIIQFIADQAARYEEQ